ncbi:MAG: hypothetical protein BWY77_00811 [bacterium ADurb.Bin431]|nr:MAG: hypothetical protein BWY77_00811 [bacterium ADurb.Bin431]
MAGGIGLILPGRGLAEAVGEAERLGIGQDRGDAAVRSAGTHPKGETLPGGADHVPAADRFHTVNRRAQAAENLVIDGDVGGAHRLAPLQINAVDVTVKGCLVAHMRTGHGGGMTAAVIVIIGMPDGRADAVIAFDVDRGILDHPPGAGNTLAADLQTAALDQPDPGAQVGVVGKWGRRALADGKVDDRIFSAPRDSRRRRIDFSRPAQGVEVSEVGTRIVIAVDVEVDPEFRAGKVVVQIGPAASGNAEFDFDPACSARLQRIGSLTAQNLRGEITCRP